MESSALILFAGNNNLTTAKINYPLGQGQPQSITFTRMRSYPPDKISQKSAAEPLGSCPVHYQQSIL